MPLGLSINPCTGMACLLKKTWAWTEPGLNLDSTWTQPGLNLQTQEDFQEVVGSS